MPISTAGNCNKQKGFTLLELSIVVVLLGIFISFTVPLLSRFARDDLAWSARRIAGTVQFLYNEAAITGREHQLSIELEKNRLGAKIVEADGKVFELERWEKRLELPEDIRIKDIQIEGRGRFVNGSSTIRFLPDGYMEKSLVHLADPKRTLTLLFNPFTGGTEVREGYYDL